MNRKRSAFGGILLTLAIWSLCLGQARTDRSFSPRQVQPRSEILDPASPAKASPQKAGIHTASGDGYWDNRFYNGTGVIGSVRAIALIDDNVFVGGELTAAGKVSVNNIAKWDGRIWSALGTGLNGCVNALAVIGTNLYAGGMFTTAGGIPANYIAKWDGTSWSAVGAGMNDYIHALAVNGNDLYAAGGARNLWGYLWYSFVARWDGTSWSELPAPNGIVYALAMSGNDIYAGGDFSGVGEVAANYIAKWDGTSWWALGSGIGTSSVVRSLVVSENDVYAGGYFLTAGGASASCIAKWDGTSWPDLDQGLDSFVYALAASEIGIYAGGSFTKAGSNSSHCIGLWTLCGLQLTSPNGDEIWGTGSNQNITWSTSGGVDSVKLEYSVDSGSTWTTIIGSTPNTGSYAWSVPNTPSPNCLVRISQVSGGSPLDISNEAFEIRILPIIQLSRSQLRFGAVHNGPKTESQKVLLSNCGGGQLNWTATSDQAWLNVTPGSGTGAAVLSIGIDPAWSLAVGTYNGHITQTRRP